MFEIIKKQDARYKQNPNPKSQNIKLVIGHCLLNTIWLLFLVSWLFSSASADEIKITRIETSASRKLDHVEIRTTGYVKGEGLHVDDQLIIEFPNTKIAKDIKIYLAKSDRIKDIATAQVDTSAVVIITLKKNVDYDLVNVFGKNKSTLALSDSYDYAAELLAAWDKAMLDKKAPALEPKKYEAAVEEPAEEVVEKPLPTEKAKPKRKPKPRPKPKPTKGLPLKGKTIVIDPGHGGLDNGAISLGGIAEKHLTLGTAKKVAAYLNNAGATVYLTRNKDRTCGIRDLVSFANRVKADIFVSIHYNYCNYKSVTGTETYYYTRRSRKLALALHRAMVRGLQRRDRGIRKAMIYTIHHAKMPAVLVEPLYISNAKEESLARSASYQNKIAQSIARGVKNYF